MLEHHEETEQPSIIQTDKQKELPRKVTHAASLECISILTAKKRNVRPYYAVLLLCLMSFLLGFPAMLILSQLNPSYPDFAQAVGSTMLFGGLLGTLLSLWILASKVARDAAREPMLLEEGATAVGPLLDRMATDVYHHTEIRRRLTELLPQMQTTDATLLLPRHFDMLNKSIHKCACDFDTSQPDERKFLMAILNAYELIGDSRALPDVQRLARSRWGLVSSDEEVMRAAQRCIPFLQQAAEAMRQKETLLRGYEVPVDTTALLCPASLGEQSRPEELLRPGYQKQDDGWSLQLDSPARLYRASSLDA